MGQVISLTTDDKVAYLRAAFADSLSQNLPLKDCIQAQLRAAMERQDQDINSSASNSHSATTNQPGTNRITDQESVRGWNAVLDGYRVARKYLLDCCKYGLDAFATQLVGSFPSPLPAELAADARVIVDASGQWADACEVEEIDAADVVGAKVGDEASFLWLLGHPNLLRISRNVSETRGDYSAAIVGRGGMTW